MAIHAAYDALAYLNGLPQLQVPTGTRGIYVAVLPTYEVKIGASKDIAQRLTSKELQGSKLVAILPGSRSGIEADLKADLRPYRSRAWPDPLHQETYKPTKEVVAFVEEAVDAGFTASHLQTHGVLTIQRPLHFNDGQILSLDVTYLQFTEHGKFAPRYVLAYKCRKCGYLRNSLDFLNSWNLEEHGRPLREYLTLHPTRWCRYCQVRPKLPAKLAFVDGQTRVRIGMLYDSRGNEVQCLDRDSSTWHPIVKFGVRRMAKKPRPGAKNDFHTLRLQPSIARRGKAQGKS